MLRNSIRARLIVGVLLVQLALALGVVSVGVYYTERRLSSSLDTALQARAMQIAALVRYSEDSSNKLIFDDALVPPAYDARFKDFFEVHSADGKLIARSQDFPDVIESLNPQQKQFELAGVPYRFVRLANVPVLDREQDAQVPENLNVFCAVPEQQFRDEVRQTGVFLGTAGLALTLLMAFIAWWTIRRSLVPLDELATSASEISVRNWELRVPSRAATPDELLPLVSAMETMLANLEQAFRLQREFVADAAHELKTPVAIVKSSLQALQQKPRSQEEYRSGIEESLDDLGRLERLVQQLLRLARAEQWASGAIERELEPVDIVGSWQQAIARLRSVSKEKGITCDLETGNAAAFVKADPDDLEIVWVNLLENAIHYSPAKFRISVVVDKCEVGCRVTVKDCGPGIAQDQLDSIFERFHRGDPSRARSTGGFGLGLAISRALVEAYHGRIHAESEPGKGTRMIVELPAESEVPNSESLSLH